MKAILRFLFVVPILSSSFLIGQTGPGGVGNSSTLEVWLDASQLGLNNGDPVSTWTDLSANGNTPTQGTAANRPTFLTAGLNGKPGVQFDGTNDFLQFPTNLPNNEQSIFMVNKRQGSYQWRFGYTSNKFNLMTLISGNLWGYYQPNAFQEGGYLNPGETKIHSVLVSSLTSSLTLGQNNSYVTKTYTTTPNRPNATLGSNNSGTNTFHQGVIPEFIVYNTLVNSAQRLIVNNYLAAKYQLAIQNDKYAMDVAHGNELAGIGMLGGQSHTDARGTSDVQINNATALSDGEYVLWGHNNGAYSLNFTDIPIGYTGARWNKLWRIDETGTVGNYDVRIFINANTIGNDNNQYFIVYDVNNGVFNDGGSATIGPGVYDALTNSVVFSGVHIPDNSWFTLANADTDILSTKTGNWNDPTAWTCNCVPDSNVDVTILNTHNISVTGYQSINNITVDAGGTLTLNTTNILSIDGDFNNSGSFVGNSGVLLFSGTALQQITNSSPRIDIFNYTQTNPSQVQLVSGALGIKNVLKLNAGSLQNVGLGNIIILADATTTARIASVNPGSALSGNFIAQRHVATRVANWSDIGSPMTNMNFGVLDQSLYFSGIGGNEGNAGPPTNIFYSAYYFDAGIQDYDSVVSTSRVLNPGEGFEIWLADDQNTFNAQTFNTSGVPNFGNVSANPYLQSSTGEWAIISNPYASWIDWVNVTKTGLKNEVWIFDAGSNNYQLHNTGNVAIPPMQGFFIEANGNSPTATFTESSKSTSNSSTFFRTTNLIDEFQLILTEVQTGFNQTTRVRLDMDASSFYEPGKDVTLLKSKSQVAPNLASLSKDGKSLMINYLNTNEETIVIPLMISVKQNGLVNLTTNTIEHLTSSYSSVLLIDKQTNTNYDLRSLTSVDIYLLTGDYNGRFELRLSNDNPNESVITVFNDLVYYTNNQIITQLDFSNSAQANIEIYNVSGQLIKSLTTSDLTTYISLPPTTSKGTYIVKVLKGTKDLSTHKVVIY